MQCVKCAERPAVPPSKLCTRCSHEEWMDTCQKLIDKHEPLGNYFKTWAKHCGAPESVFVGQTCKMLQEIFLERAVERAVEAVTSIESKLDFQATSIELLQAISPKIDEDTLMALRYLYYVKAISAVPDDRYDEAEKEYLGRDDVDDSPLMNPGSDCADDYPERIRALGFYLMLVTDERRKKLQPSI